MHPKFVRVLSWLSASSFMLAFACAANPAIAFTFDWATLGWPAGTKGPYKYINVDGSGVDFLVSYTDLNSVSVDERPASIGSGFSIGTEAQRVLDDVVGVDLQFYKTGTADPAEISLANWDFRDIDWHPAEDVYWREQLEILATPADFGGANLAFDKPSDSTVQITGFDNFFTLVNTVKENPEGSATSNRATLLSSSLISGVQLISRNVSTETVADGLTTGTHSVFLGDFNFYKKKEKHLVLLTHGYIGDAGGWVNDMQNSIAVRTQAQHPQDEVRLLDLTEYATSLPPTLPTPLSEWDILSVDWSDSAAISPEQLQLSPWGARSRARQIGQRLAYFLRQQEYETLHLIGHSAGSWLVDAIADSMESSTVDTHLTFLDAFVPNSGGDLGDRADWVEQYVNDEIFPWDFPLTNATLPWAFNIDVTDLDPALNLPNPFGGHSWPWEWYLGTIQNPVGPDARGWGFSGTNEFMNAHPSHTRYRRGSGIDLASNQMSEGKSLALSTTPLLNDPSATSTSDTGQVSDVGNNSFTLTTGSPVWLQTSFELISPAEFFRFDFEFLSLSDGLLSVFVQDRLVFLLDEGLTVGQNGSDWQWLGATLGPGTYQIRFELNSTSTMPSSLRISNIEFGFFSFVPEPASIHFTFVALLSCCSKLRRRNP
jgi:hypothetical protein